MHTVDEMGCDELLRQNLQHAKITNSWILVANEGKRQQPLNCQLNRHPDPLSEKKVLVDGYAVVK